jgi:hypothetical protein
VGKQNYEANLEASNFPDKKIKISPLENSPQASRTRKANIARKKFHKHSFNINHRLIQFPNAAFIFGNFHAKMENSPEEKNKLCMIKSFSKIS